MRTDNTLEISSGLRKYIFASGAIGNLLETYDVAICIFLAQFISITFFPSNPSENQLINTFYIFLVGYLSRPFGGFILGLFTDQIGRKKMLVISILLIGFSTAFIGLIPSYKAIGIFSIILFFILRMMQNVFASGEYIASVAYLIESSGKKEKGYFGCWAAVGLSGGLLLASFAVFITTYLIDTKIIPEWSWRLLFLSAFIGIGLGLWLRLSIPESLAFILETTEIKKANKWDIFKNSLHFIKAFPAKCVAITAITWLGVAVTFSNYIYAPLHMTNFNHFSQYEAFSINTLSLALLVFFIPLFGAISDHWNKVALLKIASLLFLIFSTPYYWYITYGSYTEALLFQCLFSIPSACFFSIAPVVIAEIFPLKIRCTTTALIYQVTASLAAGLTPIFLLQLIYKTHIFYAPAYFIMGSALLGFLCLFLLKKPLIEL